MTTSSAQHSFTPIDPRADIGHVDLTVADLDRSLAFYSGVLGFEVMRRWGDSGAMVSAGGYHHHIGLSAVTGKGGRPASEGSTGLHHLAIRYPTREALADGLRRVRGADIEVEGATDFGIAEALYVRDPDGNGVELYWDLPAEQQAPGTAAAEPSPLDLDELVATA